MKFKPADLTPTEEVVLKIINNPNIDNKEHFNRLFNMYKKPLKQIRRP
jgi:hypothetical protein